MNVVQLLHGETTLFFISNVIEVIESSTYTEKFWELDINNIDTAAGSILNRTALEKRKLFISN